MKKILLLTFSFLIALMPLVADEVVKVSDVDIPESSSDVHFAKIKNYYPGDTVIISNFDTNVSVEVVVISDINENTDISLIISKKTADALEFVQGASYSVKVGKRQQTDKKVRGNAEISCSSTVEELTGLLKNKEILKKDPISVKEEKSEESEEKVEEQPAEKSEIKEEIPAVEKILEKPEEEVQAKESPVTEMKEIFSEEEISEPEIEDLPADESEIVEDVPEVEVVDQEESEDEFVESELPESNYETVLTDEEKTESMESEKSDEVTESFVPETVETLPEENTLPQEDYSEKIVVDEIAQIPAEEETVEEEAEISHFTEIDELPEITEEKPVVETIQEEELEDVPLEPITEKVPQINEPEYYDAIILPEPEEKVAAPVVVPLDDPEIADVPVSTEEKQEYVTESEEVVPEKETEAESETLITVENTVVEVVEKTVSVTEVKNESIIEEKTLVEETETKKTEKQFEKYVVKTENLKKGKYYIQIAAYKSEENIMEIVNKYGKKYPLSFVELSENRGYKILVGPLSVDEYKVVLERFKSYGFKDAFVKKQ